jgi:predicted membrane channel-forming protein YqfA (hemolysin III family)
LISSKLYGCLLLDNSLISGVFITFGLSGIAPATHFGYVNGWQKSIDEAAIPWLILMGILYITGALLYAMRIPERFFPGKVDIWVSRDCCPKFATGLNIIIKLNYCKKVFFFLIHLFARHILLMK